MDMSMSHPLLLSICISFVSTFHKLQPRRVSSITERIFHNAKESGHFNYHRAEHLQDAVHTPVKPFDYDVLIQITPETYHDLKDKIGREIMSLMSK